MSTYETWVPGACTLPTVERPQRSADFGEMFGRWLWEQERPDSTRLRWRLDPASEATARSLTSRETRCCSFFSFTIVRETDALLIELVVPAEHIDVLDGLQARASAGMAQ